MKGAPASKPRSPQAGPAAGLSWSGNDKPNGSAAVSVKQPLSPLWDARIGADMTVAPGPAQTESQLLAEKLANGGNLPQSSGTAWAAVTAPGLSSIWDKTAVEARLDPGQEQSKLGTSLSKSIPFSEQYSLTLQNGYNVTEQGALPLPGIPGRPARNYDTEQSAKLSITETGTSFMAGQTLSTANDKWLRKIGAEQKLFGDVTINGSIGETPQGADQQKRHGGIQAQLVGRKSFARNSLPMIRHCRILAALPSKSKVLMGSLHIRRAGDVRARFEPRNRGIADDCHSFRKNRI